MEWVETRLADLPTDRECSRMPVRERVETCSPVVDIARPCSLQAGDRVVAHADGAGRVILEREHDVVAEFAGALTGTYRPDELDDLRSEWD